jgi:hypothetical protein
VDSADAIALVAQGAKGEMIGVLLGALNPASHYRTMLRRHGLALGFWLLVRTVTHPRFALELLATRLLRYASGVLRMEIPDGPPPASKWRAVSLMSSMVSCLRRSRRLIISRACRKV